MEDRIIKRENVYKGRIVQLQVDTLEDKNGKRYFREIVRHPGAVAIVPFAGADEIYLIRQYRYPHNEVIYEIPAGTLEEGEDYETCAAREIEEELGLCAGRLERVLLIYPSPGVMDEKIMIFRAADLARSRQNLEDDEELVIEKMPFNRALELIKDGKIRDAKTICALLYLKEFAPQNNGNLR